jgi:hypothetical protein
MTLSNKAFQREFVTKVFRKFVVKSAGVQIQKNVFKSDLVQ